jgi:hypothetical protein
MALVLLVVLIVCGSHCKFVLAMICILLVLLKSS